MKKKQKILYRAQKKIIKSSQRVTLVADFNCNEVNWEIFENGGENTWGNRLLRLTMNNTMIQWVTENTRFRGEDKPSRLDILFTKRIKSINRYKL